MSVPPDLAIDIGELSTDFANIDGCRYPSAAQFFVSALQEVLPGCECSYSPRWPKMASFLLSMGQNRFVDGSQGEEAEDEGSHARSRHVRCG